MSTKPPIIVAHRGLHHHAVENSIEAFVAAAQAGLPWVECDVWPSCEGVPVVIHDNTLDRTTPGSGFVGQHSCRELKELGVASLQEVLSVLADRSTGILIEIKPPDGAGFCRTVEQLARGFPGPWMIQSFHPDTIEPVMQNALLVENMPLLRAAMAGLWPSIHAEHSLISRAIVDELHDSGRKIGAWTVNDADEIRRLVELGVDVLITDDPETAMGICRVAVAPKGH